MKPLALDEQRLQRHIDQLSAISEAPAPVVPRVLFSEADLKGRHFVKSLAAKAAYELLD